MVYETIIISITILINSNLVVIVIVIVQAFPAKSSDGIPSILRHSSSHSAST